MSSRLLVLIRLVDIVSPSVGAVHGYLQGVGTSPFSPGPAPGRRRTEHWRRPSPNRFGSRAFPEPVPDSSLPPGLVPAQRHGPCRGLGRAERTAAERPRPRGLPWPSRVPHPSLCPRVGRRQVLCPRGGRCRAVKGHRAWPARLSRRPSGVTSGEPGQVGRPLASWPDRARHPWWRGVGRAGRDRYLRSRTRCLRPATGASALRPASLVSWAARARHSCRRRGRRAGRDRCLRLATGVPGLLARPGASLVPAAGAPSGSRPVPPVSRPVPPVWEPVHPAGDRCPWPPGPVSLASRPVIQDCPGRPVPSPCPRAGRCRAAEGYGSAVTARGQVSGRGGAGLSRHGPAPTRAEPGPVARPGRRLTRARISTAPHTPRPPRPAHRGCPVR